MRIAALSIALAMMSAVAAQADDEPIGIRVIYTEDFPPFNFENDGEIKGISVDLLK